MPFRTINVDYLMATPILEVLGNTTDAYTLVNNDIANTIWIGTHRNCKSTDSDVVAIPPLGSAPLPTSESTYAIAQSPNIVQCLLIPGTGGWTAAPSQIQASLNVLGLAKDTSVQSVKTTLGTPAQTTDINGVVTTLGTPAQHLDVVTTLPTNISNTGVPLLAFKNLLVDEIAQALAATTAISFPSSSTWYSVTQIGYEIALQFTTAAVTATPVTISLFWSDSTSGLITSVETYNVYAASNSGGAHGIYGRGPSKGNQLRITMTSGANPLTYSFALFQSSRLYHRDFWTSVQPAGGITIEDSAAINDAFVPNSGYIANVSAAVAATTNVTTHMALYNGTVNILGRTSSSTTDMTVTIYDYLSGPLQSQVIYEITSNAQGYFIGTDISLPRSQCLLNLVNNNAAGKTLAVSIQGQELQTA